MKQPTPHFRSWMFLLLKVSLFSILTLLQLQALGRTLEEGQLFFSPTLPLLEDGRPVSLERFRGKKLVLHIFASW